MKRRFEVFHDGHRYWATMKRIQDKFRFQFWSDHDWPFYHGHYDQKANALNPDEAWKQFVGWLPFEFEEV